MIGCSAGTGIFLLFKKLAKVGEMHINGAGTKARMALHHKNLPHSEKSKITVEQGIDQH